jgi:RNA polymerase sigma factor (sigma-70 family)
MQPLDRTREQRRLAWLAEIYRAYAPDLQRYIYQKVGDLPLAEDLTSTVFLKALRWLKEDQSAESARGWLYATARTTIIDHWQSQGHVEARSLLELADQFSIQLDSASVAQQQAAQRVQHLLSLLPERERSVLTLRYLQGYSAAEIAEALGTNAGHIRVLQLRALRRAAQLEVQERQGFTMQESPFDTCIKLLTPESRRVFDLALQEAQTMQHWWIGTEHLLWGLASEGSLASFFTPHGLSPERIHAGLVFIFERQAQQIQAAAPEMLPPDNRPDPVKMLTPRAKQTIMLAGDEMKSQGEQNIKPAHLLLGLMNEGEGIGAGLLRSLGVSLLQARAFLAPASTGQTCTFCGRTGSQAKRIFPAQLGISTSPVAFICDKCVERFHAMLKPAE